VHIGRRSRQAAQIALQEENPNYMMLQETTSQAQHAEFMIQKEREYERVQQKLYEEFKQLDVNQDGSITLDEVIEFLRRKVSFTEAVLTTSREEKT